MKPKLRPTNAPLRFHFDAPRPFWYWLKTLGSVGEERRRNGQLIVSPLVCDQTPGDPDAAMAKWTATAFFIAEAARIALADSSFSTG